jgi:hypothetical protein
MNDKVHRYLDGELQPEELNSLERRQAAEYEGITEEMGRAYKAIDVPDLTTRVMERVSVLPLVVYPTAGRPSISQRIKRTYGWLWKPRTISLRPAYGLLLVVVLTSMVALPKTRRFTYEGLLRSTVGKADVSPSAAKVFVQFRLAAPNASSVRLAGSFTGWEPKYALDQISPGIWSILIPLDPGVHNYSFVVNAGEWIADPAAPAVDDGFGGVNSRLSVLLPDGASNL